MKELYSKGFMLQSKVETKGSLGGRSEEWTTELTFDAVIDFMGGQVAIEANKQIENSTHILMIEDDYDQLISLLQPLPLDKRIKFNGKIYEVEYIDEPFGSHLEIFVKYGGEDYEV